MHIIMMILLLPLAFTPRGLQAEALPLAPPSQGAWHLEHTETWAIVNTETNIAAPIAANATILNCDGQPLSLTDSLQGAEARILQSSQPSNPEETWHAQTIQIICR